MSKKTPNGQTIIRFKDSILKHMILVHPRRGCLIWKDSSSPRKVHFAAFKRSLDILWLAVFRPLNYHCSHLVCSHKWKMNVLLKLMYFVVSIEWSYKNVKNKTERSFSSISCAWWLLYDFVMTTVWQPVHCTVWPLRTNCVRWLHNIIMTTTSLKSWL